MTTTPVRRKKFTRIASQRLPIVLQDRDLDILKLVANFYLINTQQLERLTVIPYKTLCARLQKLYHNHYLQRVSFPGCQNMPTVYTLDREGANYLAANLEMIFPKTALERLKNGSFKPVSVDHELMISELHTGLILAQKKAGFKLAKWTQDQRQKDNILRTSVSDNDVIYPISPDALIDLHFPDRPGKSYAHFFLEADTGSETVEKRFFKKMRGYWLWWYNDGHKEKFNIKGFRVLTVTKSEKRMQNLREITRRADNRQAGSELFYFTTEEQYKDKPEALLNPIWYTPKDDTAHSILE